MDCLLHLFLAVRLLCIWYSCLSEAMCIQAALQKRFGLVLQYFSIIFCTSRYYKSNQDRFCGSKRILFSEKSYQNKELIKTGVKLPALSLFCLLGIDKSCFAVRVCCMFFCCIQHTGIS